MQVWGTCRWSKDWQQKQPFPVLFNHVNDVRNGWDPGILKGWIRCVNSVLLISNSPKWVRPQYKHVAMMLPIELQSGMILLVPSCAWEAQVALAHCWPRHMDATIASFAAPHRPLCTEGASPLPPLGPRAWGLLIRTLGRGSCPSDGRCQHCQHCQHCQRCQHKNTRHHLLVNHGQLLGSPSKMG